MCRAPASFLTTMVTLFAALVGAFTVPVPVSAAAMRASELASREAVLSWIQGYHRKPIPKDVPSAMLSASKFGAFREVDSAGVYVGFIAGVLASDPGKAETLMLKLLALPADEHWVIVRAVAYSGLPRWKVMLGSFAARMPRRKVMVDKYLAGNLPTLNEFAFQDDPGMFGKMRNLFSFNNEMQPKRTAFEPHPDLIDTFWGYYFATGAYHPIGQLVAMLAWSKERDSIEKLTLASMAKYTLSSNAARDAELLSMLKWARTQQPKDTAHVITEIIDAAETADTPRLRKEALGAIDELKRKGPGSKRDVTLWGQVGQGAVSLGCLGLAVAGQVQFGVPCVVGGALSSAGLYWWGQQQ
jgi:hypothetical protein